MWLIIFIIFLMNTNMKIKNSTKCLFPETKPDLFFEEQNYVVNNIYKFFNEY